MNAVNIGLVTFIIQHNRIQGIFLLCKITNLPIYSNKKRKIFDGIYDILNYKCFNIYFENNVPWRGTEINTTMIK